MALAAKALHIPRQVYIADKKPVPAKSRAKILARALFYLLMLSALIALPVLIYREATTNPYFEIKTVEIIGNDRLPAYGLTEDVQPFLTGNIFTSDIGGATAFLNADPWIASASVRRKFPDGIEVYVTERVPTALIQLDHLYLIDADGVLIEETRTPKDRLVIAGFAGRIRPGGRVDDWRLADAYALVDIFARDTVFSDPVTFVDVSDPDRFVARTKSGVLLRFGPEKKAWEEKFLEYLTVRKILTDKGTSFSLIDLSFQDQVVVLPEGNGRLEGIKNITKG